MMMIPNCEGISAPPESSLPLPPEREKDIISELLNKANADQKEGDVVCIIAERWWRDWKQYVGFESISEHFASSKNPNQVQWYSPRRPGKIDNSELVLDGEDEEGYELNLRTNLQELEDYNFVPLEVWNKLLEWYDGGPELRRKLICVRPAPKSLKVEVHPLRLHLINASNNSLRTITMSRKASVSELYNSICTLLKLDPAEVRVWDYFTRSKFKLLNEFDQNLEDANLLMDQEILLEVKVDGVWPSSSDMDITGSELALVPVEPSTSPISIAGGPNMSNGGFSTRFGTHFLQGNSFSFAGRSAGDTDDMVISGMKVVGRGLAGLNNLGNTCFMNSAVQCLVHTPPLVDFFLHDYTEEINKDNPLGMQGELAIAFGELLRKLWSSGRVPVAPREFKARLGRFAPQFSGYNQHDSQELLAFLLDGLHEDLNRVKNKPYIEANDPKGRTDEEFADECWQNHKARNDSIIVDVCQGQYKSTLVCPDCSKVSVTFDPFMYLSLPLPSTLTRKMTVTVFSGEGSHLPMPYTVTVPKNGCCKDLVQALCIECCLKSSESLLLAKANDHKIVRYLDYSFEPLSSIKDEEHLVAYKLPVNHDRLLRLEIMHQRKLLEPQENERPKLFGTPLLTCLAPDSKTEEDIQAVVGKVLAPLLRAKVCTPSQPKAVINKCGESSDCMVLTGDDACCEDSTSNMDLEDTTIGHPSFQLSLVDDKGVSNSPFDSGSMFLSGSCVKVLLDWSDRYLQLYNLSFLEDLPEVFKYGFMAKKTRQEAPSLFSCLEAFLKEEPLGPDDMWYCPNCKEHRQATKKLDLWRLPEILVVHLKRFSYNWILKNKLDTFVNYPLHNLDLSPYVKQSSASPKSHVYELYAVSNHYGGLGGGHYSAYAKLLDEDRWYHFDDSLVSPVSEDAIKTSAAYVLFYRRVGADSSMGVDELPKCSDSPSW